AYHWVTNPELKKTLRIADHINIYFLIAGTYTPVALIALGDDNGWALFIKIWSIAIFGTFFKLFYTGKFEFISLLLYVVMGWLIVFDFDQLAESTSKLGLGFLMLGGAFYTLGITFYAWQRIPYHHFIWHLFVLAGAISHWVFIYIDVV
ncbi:MAG: hemolysin III family protein, partial [Pricia sp.]|nr:hemolysin III family protein [Pricia sp.]